jgi:hypothetical protein
MILLLFSALLGSACTFLGLVQHGFLIALLASPFGGSLAAFLAGAYLCLVRLNSEASQQGRAASTLAISEQVEF